MSNERKYLRFLESKRFTPINNACVIKNMFQNVKFLLNKGNSLIEKNLFCSCSDLMKRYILEDEISTLPYGYYKINFMNILFSIVNLKLL
jgi:hypothetical protein